MHKHLIHANWHNLTSLWKELGARSLQWFPQLNGSDEWPRRHWFSDDAAPFALSQFSRLSPGALVTIMSDHPSRQALQASSFAVVLEQRGMILELTRHTSGPPSRLVTLQVRDRTTLEVWLQVASCSFGFDIELAPVERLLDSSSTVLLLASVDGQPAASALLHWTDKVCGIHLVGVIPQLRRQGVARQLMQEILDHVQCSGGDFATLQASSKGLPLYRQLGFLEQFTLETYAKKTPTG